MDEIIQGLDLTLVEFIGQHFLVIQDDVLFATYFKNESNEIVGVGNVRCPLDKFIFMFEAPLSMSLEKGTSPIEEIRIFDPDNKFGYNDLIVLPSAN